MTDNITIPFNKLVRTEKNVRRQGKAANIEGLAASILAQGGVLQNLVVTPVEGADTYGVVAGDRRMSAIELLVEQGKVPAEWPVPVKVVAAQAATAASLAENTEREQMHPADEFEAFRTLAEGEGWTIDKIADAFGVTPLVVERRLKLIAAAPELIEEFRAGELSTDQLIALCATDDHTRQVDVWKRSRSYQWMCDPKSLRKAVLAAAGEISTSNDPRIPFIGGLAVYTAAGGEVRRDLLMGDGSGGFITDEALLDSLVADKLQEHAEAVRAEGWGWVELWPEWDWQAFHRFGHAPTTDANMPEDARQKIAALEAKRETLAKEQEELHGKAEAEDRDLTDDEWQRDSEIDDRDSEIAREIEDIEEAHVCYAPEVMAKAGAIVTLENGKLRIERGLVKTADRKAVAAAVGDENAVSGGRETEPAGRKADALSDALRRSLLGHRNLAAQIEAAKRPDVAKVLLACSMIEDIRSRITVGFGYRGAGAPCDYVIGRDGYGGTRTHHPITDEAGKAAKAAFLEACKAVVKPLPEAEGKLWDALAAMKPAELDNIIAHGVALSVSLAEDHKGLTAKLLEALGFDMAAHFTPTADNYLGRVSKPLMVEALTEAKQVKNDADKAALLAMKKGALATEAETRLAGSGWVPKGIRTPAPKKPKAAKPAAAKVGTKKAPAKKAATSKPKAQPKRKAPAPADAQAAA